MNHNPVRTLALLSTLLLSATYIAAVPATLGYGNIEQWQVGLSGTCQVASSCTLIGLPPGTTGGFWGWCALGGSSGSSAIGTTGTSADCQISFYIGSPSTVMHISGDYQSWLIATGSGFLPAGTPGFFFTSGTNEFTGPGTSIFRIPPGIPFPLSQLCNFSNVPTSLAGNPNCDSGIPAIPGHHSLHPAPGVELNLQVNQLP